ncbi:MAG: Fibronectin type III domain protein [candidate division WS6 bacterium OLB20]|uniref:Fibronectin type III domain protein n=1 Tax=candidate division WS6 bacterium OLB20 TaxID=1617426 RepID=A0A136LVU3_9BACT|nr:MAG: Fibronectin type III domain protein [candidate division WS6 bacterium OLB20]
MEVRLHQGQNRGRIINGDILMDGTNGLIASPGGGGGAGGSILIEGETCDINGTLSAEGGDGGDEAFDGGGGGGGRISILTTLGPCNVNGSVSVAQGTSSGGQVGQVGTYPDIATIPSTPTFREQFKSDALTTIPVGGRTQEQEVVLKVNISDPGATPGNPATLQAEFEVVETGQVFTGTNVVAVDVTDEPGVLGISTAPPQAYTGGTALISEAQIAGLTPGVSYKWRARVVNVTDGINGSWVEYGNNGSNQPDFIVSTVESLSISPSATSVNAGDPISLTVTALDGSMSQDPTYAGTVTFSSTSPTAALPANYTFSSGDSGSRTFTDSLVFFEGGTYTVTVTDTINGALTATTADITVVGPSPTVTPSPETSVSVTPTASGTATVVVEPPVISCSEDPLQLACQVPVTISNVTVTNNTPTAVTVCWDTNIPTKGSVSYGLYEAAVYTKSTATGQEYRVTGHCMTIDTLEEDTRYIFRIRAQSAAGKQAFHEGAFATDGEIITVLPETGSCIVQSEPPYSLNVDNQVLITYTTKEPGTCVMRYGQEPENLRFESVSAEATTSHTGVIELSNLLQGVDIYYQMDCTVELTSEESTLCEAQGVVPASVFSGLIPTPTPVAREGLEAFAGTYAPVLLMLATGATLLSNLYALPRLVLYAIGWVRDRKRYKVWGIVYDAKTRKPVPFAAVRVYKGKEFIKEKLTDLQGRYGLPSDKGTFRLEVEHPEYGKVERSVEIEEDDGTIAEDIAVNMTAAAKKAEFKRNLRKNLHRINTVLVYSGLAFSIVATLISPVAFNFFVVVLYVLQFALLLLLDGANKRNWGYVYNSQTRNRLPGAFVRLFSISEERQIDVQMTDESGRYGFSPEPGEYHLTVDLPGYRFPSEQTNQVSIYKSPKGNAFLRVDAAKEPVINRVIPMDPKNAAAGATGKASPFG